MSKFDEEVEQIIRTQNKYPRESCMMAWLELAKSDQRRRTMMSAVKRYVLDNSVHAWIKERYWAARKDSPDGPTYQTRLYYDLDNVITGFIVDQLYPSIQRFNEVVWRNGLFDIIDKSDRRGVGGVFGNTHLMTFACAGRVMLTFQGIDEFAHSQVTFVADESDPTGNRTGQNSADGPLDDMKQRILDVILNWPETREEQEKIFAPEGNITYCGLGAGT